MSRRAKLIITAVFLALLAIPLAYVALTWTTPNPLRFHSVSNHDPLKAEALCRIELVVENTSDLPVHLFLGFKYWKTLGGLPDGGIYPERPGFIHIAPRGSVSLSAHVEHHAPGLIPSGEVYQVAYSWLSGTTYRLDDVRLWLLTHLPEPLSAMVPRDILFHDITTLEVPAPEQAPPPAASTP
jgi:hypothetical protein